MDFQWHYPMDFQWHFPMDVHLFSGMLQRIDTCPVDFRWNSPMDFQWHFTMDVHSCEFWRARFCPDADYRPHHLESATSSDSLPQDVSINTRVGDSLRFAHVYLFSKHFVEIVR